MRRLAFLAILCATPATAFADAPPEGTPVAATAGTDPGKVFDDAVDAHYKANSDDPTCAPKGGCKSKVLKTVKVKGGGVVQMRMSTSDYGDVYAAVIGDGAGNWFSPDALDNIFLGNCGAGQCADAKFGSISAKQASGILWVTVTVKAREYEDDPHQKMPPWDKYMVVYACQTGAAPRCATIQAGGLSTSGSVSIKGNQVKVKEGDSKRTVTVTF